MSRHPLFLASSILLFGACPGPGAESESSAESTTGVTGGIVIPDDSTSTGDGDTTTTATPTTGADETTLEPTTGELNCGVADIKAEVRIPRVMLVLDKSGSMVATPSGYWDADDDPNTPDVTRWSSLYAVVDFIVGNFESRMDFGAILFPSIKATKDYNAGACATESEPEVPVGPDQGAVILATIPGSGQTNFLGGTPAAVGITTAIAGLPRNDALELADDLRYIVLVTDGAANCAVDAATNNELFENYDEHFPEMVAAAKDAGIPTFVVGIDIKDELTPVKIDGSPDATNTYERLNMVAEIGGQARDGDEKFYNTQNQLELQAALEAISQEITSCTFTLNAPLKKYQYIRELVVQSKADPLEYSKTEVTDCAAESGWHFTDDTRAAIELCGDACTAYKATGEVDIIFDCNAG